MSQSFLKKIINVKEFNEMAESFQDLLKNDLDELNHCLGLKHDLNLIAKSLAHESLLLWNFHVWAHFNGEKWDGIFIGLTRKSEKFNKKIMEEYLWMSKNPKISLKLYETAVSFAKEQKCDFIHMNVIEGFKKSKSLKKFYLKNGFVKDTESYMKKLN